MKNAYLSFIVLTSLHLCLTNAGFSAPGILIVVDERTGSGVESDVFRVDPEDKKHFAGKTDLNGVCRLTNPGVQGEKFVAISEEYNPGEALCPLQQATIRVRKTTLLEDHRRKATFLSSIGRDSEASLEFRKASVLAEKEGKTQLANELESSTVKSLARALKVQRPFVETAENRVAESPELKDKILDFQRSHNLRETGAINRDTLNEAVVVEKSSER